MPEAKETLPGTKRLAIVRLSSIGDVLLALPAFEGLRRTFPTAHIAWIVERRARNLLDGYRGLDEIIEYPKHVWKELWKRPFGRLRSLPAVLAFYRSLKARRFDAVIDFQGNLKSGSCTFATRAPLRFGFERKECKEPNWLFTNRRLVLNGAAVHRADRDLLLAGMLGVPLLHHDLGIDFQTEDRTPGEVFIPTKDARPGFVALHPGTSDFMPHKRWPLPHYAALGRRLHAETGVQIAISWGPGEEDMAQRLKDELGDFAHVIPKTPTMKSLGWLLARTRLVIGGDTGPVHLASMMRVPTLALMGPSDPRHYYPHGHPDRVLFRRTACSPCRNRACQDLTCVQELLPEVVAAKALEVLEHPLGRSRDGAN